jgi:flagellar biosynthesis chaperone FliJ
MLVLMAAVTALAFQRQNGHIDHNKPEPTILMQLQQCRHSLATAQQSAEIWRTLAEKQKVIIAGLSAELENSDR